MKARHVEHKGLFAVTRQRATAPLIVRSKARMNCTGAIDGVDVVDQLAGCGAAKDGELSITAPRGFASERTRIADLAHDRGGGNRPGLARCVRTPTLVDSRISVGRGDDTLAGSTSRRRRPRTWNGPLAPKKSGIAEECRANPAVRLPRDGARARTTTAFTERRHWSDRTCAAL